MDCQRWNPLLALSRRSPENRRSPRVNYCSSATITWSKLSSLWLRLDHTHNFVERLASWRRRWALPRSFGCQHRSRSRLYLNQWQRTIPWSKHRLHDKHTARSVHNDTRQTIPFPYDYRLLVSLPCIFNRRRPHTHSNCHWWRARSSRQCQHRHFVLRWVVERVFIKSSDKN